MSAHGRVECARARVRGGGGVPPCDARRRGFRSPAAARAYSAAGCALAVPSSTHICAVGAGSGVAAGGCGGAEVRRCRVAEVCAGVQTCEAAAAVQSPNRRRPQRRPAAPEPSLGCRARGAPRGSSTSTRCRLGGSWCNTSALSRRNMQHDVSSPYSSASANCRSPAGCRSCGGAGGAGGVCRGCRGCRGGAGGWGAGLPVRGGCFGCCGRGWRSGWRRAAEAAEAAARVAAHVEASCAAKELELRVAEALGEGLVRAPSRLGGADAL